MFKGFKQFIFRGNIIDLAVGILIGTAFGAVINALVKDLLTPLIAAIFKAPDFSNLSFSVNSSKFLYGDFINNIISFLIISAAIYFFVVIPINNYLLGNHKNAPATKKCPLCMSTIPIKARRCPNCTSRLTE